MMPNKVRNVIISIFVILWLAVFHYESARYFYLQPLFNKPLPKVKFLFPPAGWIMFFNVDDVFGFVEVYGQKMKQSYIINPHEIIETRTIMYDNIHRNIMSTVGNGAYKYQFCEFLKRKFPDYDQFMITSIYYPSLTKNRFKQYRQIMYTCKGAK